ncbi:hypothetical protein, partial [Muriicola sp.]|uniref:hypothetical protein n=1 Tax=Muriicola sp. TaxID=2020856 RepID=UPI003563C046
MDLRRLRAKLRNQAEKRSELVVKIKDRIDPRVRSLQDELFELAIEAILNELEFKDGKIVGGVNNMSRVNRMQFMGQFYGKESAGMGFINWLLGALVKINGATMSYFRSFKDPKFPAVSERVEKIMFRRIG